MLDTIAKGCVNIFKIKEVRTKVFITLGIILVCRIIANIPCPGIDVNALGLYLKKFGGASTSDVGILFGIFDMFTGGAIEKFAIATLGIIPYISASIIMQMLQPVVPKLGRMLREEGDEGRYKFNQYVKYLTLIICIIQGFAASYSMMHPYRIGLPVPENSIVIDPGIFFVLTTVVILVCGTMILVWLGEKITEYGIGNGASIIITIGILSRVPNACHNLYNMFTNEMSSIQNTKLIYAFLLFFLFVFITMATIMLIQGQRRVPMYYMKSMMKNNLINTKSNYIPLKVNFSGVMPLILSSAIMMVPSFLIRMIPSISSFSRYFNYGSALYIVIYGLMILFFSYFWVINQFNPINLANSIARDGAFVPGIRPGKPTAEYFDDVMTKITLSGSIFLIFISIFPMLISNQLEIQYIVSSFFGGTSLIIMVGVTLDVLNQLESHMITRNYDTFMGDSRIIGRR